MKLKQKLAHDFTTLIDRETIDARDPNARQRATDRAFLAGFEAVIEIILQEFKDCEDGDLYIEYPYSWFRDLGEEECN